MIFEGVNIKNLFPFVDFIFLEDGSTNNYAKTRGFAGNTVIFAERQSDGRGRSGKSFLSETGGLYMSIAVPDAKNAKAFPLIAAVSTAAALKKFGVSCGVKWPNDILANGKKLSGILCSLHENCAVAGIGVNIENDVSALGNIATSTQTLGFCITREALAAEIIKEFFNLKDKPLKEIITLYRPLCETLGTEITLPTGEEAYVLGVDDDGFLEVEVFGKIQKLYNPVE